MMPEQSEPSQPSATRTIFFIALLATMIWLSALGLLSQRFEPSVVNQLQIRRADCVVIGVPTEVDKKRVEVRETLAGKPFEESLIAVSNLDKVRVTEGEAYIIALWNDGRIVKVSNPSKPGSGGPRVYPNTEDVRRQVDVALKRGRIKE